MSVKINIWQEARNFNFSGKLCLLIFFFFFFKKLNLQILAFFGWSCEKNKSLHFHKMHPWEFLTDKSRGLFFSLFFRLLGFPIGVLTQKCMKIVKMLWYTGSSACIFSCYSGISTGQILVQEGGEPGIAFPAAAAATLILDPNVRVL